MAAATKRSKVMNPRFFSSAKEWRRWLEKNHRTKIELLVGFYSRGSGRPSMTWPESVDEALCFGWIDGVRCNRDTESYTIRFSVRKRGSTWSAVNIRKIQALTESGKMSRAGTEKFETRIAAKSRTYSYEQNRVSLEENDVIRFRREREAWQFFQAQPPSYRKKTIWWVRSARQPITHEKRLSALIQACAERRRI